MRLYYDDTQSFRMMNDLVRGFTEISQNVTHCCSEMKIMSRKPFIYITSHEGIHAYYYYLFLHPIL